MLLGGLLEVEGLLGAFGGLLEVEGFSGAFGGAVGG